jgi:hypothetical protein
MTKRHEQRKSPRETDALTLSRLRKRFAKADRLIVKTSIIKAIVRLGARLKEREDGLGAIDALARSSAGR